MPQDRTVLVVEDEALVALSLESQLNDLGLSAVVVSTLQGALAAIDEHQFDLAVLDYDLRGAKTDPIASRLRARRIPFVVCSGVRLDELSEAFSGAEVLPKPYSDDHLVGAIRKSLQLSA